MAFRSVSNKSSNGPVQPTPVLLDKFNDLTSQPELFVGADKKLNPGFRKLTKQLYNGIREQNAGKKSIFHNENALDTLCTGNMDEDALWAQLEIDNRFFVKKFVKMFCEDETPKELVDERDDLFAVETDEESSLASDNEMDQEIDQEINDEDQALSSEEEIEDENSENEEDEDIQKMSKKYKLNGEKSDEEDDDVLFKSGQYDEKQLESEFNKMAQEEEDEYNGYKESEEEEEEEEEEEIADDMDQDSEEDLNKSQFELQEDKLKKQVAKLEAESLKEKPWQLKGETDATSRPENSLLEEYVDFESGQRAAPIITEEVSKRLEQIILGRIKDKKFDDVERKVKQAEKPFEYKKRIILDSEKSKVGLAQLYENEFLKARANSSEEAEPAAHTEIRTKMRHLFLQLDALCNFNYTPKIHSSEIKIVNNLPAISAEEAIPGAVSDAQLIAPQEVVKPSKRDVKGELEKTKTDRLRDRRIKKLRIKEKIKYNEQRGVPTRFPGAEKKAAKQQEKTLKDIALKTKKSVRTEKSKEHEQIRNVFMKTKRH